MAPDTPSATAATPATATRPVLDVEIFSDVVCPWCYIGKRRFERAAAELHDEVELRVTFRPFQLDPRAPEGVTSPVREAYARKFGGPERADALLAKLTRTAADEGLEFHLDRALRANTRRAHRLLGWAERPDTPVDQTEMKERLLRAYFVEGLDVGDVDVLADLAAESGADADDVRAHLSSSEGTDELHRELTRADELGITAVPTFVIGGRWQVPGAQEPETLVQVIRRAVDRLRPTPPTP